MEKALAVQKLQRGLDHAGLVMHRAKGLILAQEIELADLRARAEAFDLIETHKMSVTWPHLNPGPKQWCASVAATSGKICYAADLTEAIQVLAARLEPPAGAQ